MGAHIWTTAHIAALVRGFELEWKAGYQAESRWKPASIERVVVYILQQTQYKFTASQVKDRYSAVSTHSSYVLLHCIDIPQLKKDWKAIKALCGLSGFGWDEETQMVTAEPGVFDVYNNVRSNSFLSSFDFAYIYLQTHDKADRYRKLVFPHYNTMDKICAKVTATGRNIVTSSPRVHQSDRSSTKEASPAPSSRESSPEDGAPPSSASQSLKVQ
jgi:hypothetical protein